MLKTLRNLFKQDKEKFDFSKSSLLYKPVG